MFPAALALKGKAALSGSEAEQKIAKLLLDEDIQVMSSFELNQIASLTYGEMVCDEIFEVLESVLSHYIEFSPLCLQKALVVTKHVVIYGSEKCVNSAWALGGYVEPLEQYNTVLVAQQRQGPDAWWQRVKGGGVDKGFPVRDAAKDLRELLSSREHIQMMRHTKADPNSLVPVGNDKVAFISDDVRHYMLKKRLEEQRMIHTKSNLAKERGGYGGGFQSKDGGSVVGAAHSLEEMMAHAKRKEKKKFSDDGPIHSTQQQQQDYLDYQAPHHPGSAAPAAAPEVDLLDFSSPEPAPASTDLLGTGGGADLLGTTTTASSSADATADLLSLMTVAPAAAPPLVDLTASSQAPPPVLDSFQPVTTEATTSAATETPLETKVEPMKKSIMSSNVDRFSALDALSPNNAAASSSTGLSSGMDAESRILGSFSLKGAVEASTPPTNGGSSIMPNGLDSINQQTPAMEAPGSGVWPPPAVAPQEFVQPDYSSISMGVSYGDPSPAGEDDDDNGFVMGGVAGSGLEPTAAAPAAAPPPPPPC